VIVVAILSNLVFKTATVWLLGHRSLLKKVLVATGLVFVASFLLLAYWPTV
jgi:hypothetical protein